MKKVVKILSCCLCIMLACFCFVGCLGGSFPQTALPTEDDVKKIIDDAVAEQKEALVDVFKNNFNGIKVVYMPDQASDVEAEKALDVLSSASKTALDYIKVTNPELLLEFADFYWTFETNTYKLNKVENYHYTATIIPADALKIKKTGTNYFWFDGEGWQILSAVPEENYHYTLSVGESTKYFYINDDAASHKYYYNETETYDYDDETSVELELFYETVYFYINSLNLVHPYYYNHTAQENYAYIDGTSQDLTLVVGNRETQADETNLVADLDGFVNTYKNKLTAAFINSICELKGADAIDTREETDGQTPAYVQILKNKIKLFSYFGLKNKDATAGINYLKTIPVGLSDETVTESIATAQLDVFLSLGKNWQYNIYIENFTIESLEELIKDENAGLGVKKYLSIIYMTKNSYVPYEQDETTTLYPDECTYYFESEGDIHATFNFLAKDAEGAYSHPFEIIHHGDIMKDEDVNPFEDQDGNPIVYDGENALNLEIFKKAEDVTNVLALNTGFTKENDETSNGAGWAGVVRTFNGTNFNSSLIESLDQTEVLGIERIYYRSATHDVMQIVFNKTESFNISAIGSLSLYDASQIDWEKMNELFGQDQG